MDSCACTVGVDYRVHANHATKLLQLRETDGGEKGEIFALFSKNVQNFAIFAKNRAVFGENLAIFAQNLRMSKKIRTFVAER